MLRNGHVSSEHHALNGLPQLAKLIQGILDKSIKKVNERDAAIRDIGTIVSNCASFYLSGADTHVYPLNALVTDLCSLALFEVKNNAGKLAKNPSSCKTACFELTTTMLNKLSERGLLCDSYAVFLDFVFTVLDEPFLNYQMWMEDDVSSVLTKFVNSSISFIAEDYFKKLWSVVWRRFPAVVQNNGRSCGNYLHISLALVKNLHKSSMISGDSGYNIITEVIEKLFAAMEKKDIKRWNGQIEYAIEFLSFLIDEWGIECRDSLLTHCIPLAGTLVEKLDFSSSTASDLDVFWAFFDRLFHLAIPDCQSSYLVPTEVYCLAQSACDVLRRALLSLTLSRVDYELKRDHVPLFARILLIADYTPCNDLDASVSCYTQRAKRVDFNDRPHYVVSCISVALEIVSRWRHRIEPDRLTAVASKVWTFREHIKLDCQKDVYCRLLELLLQNGLFDDLCCQNRDVIKTLWNFAISVAHLQGVFESASLLLLSLINRYRSDLGDEEDLTDAISDILSRSTARRGKVIYELVAFLITNFEFDEMKHFPGVNDKKKGLKQWRFRCQVAEWLICHIDPEANIGELLFLLCSLHPATKSKPSYHTTYSKNGIERDLELFGLINPQCSPKKSVPLLPIIVITELVGYVNRLISQCWSNSDLNDEVRIALWCSFTGFLSKPEIELGDEAAHQLDKMNQWLCAVLPDMKPELLSLIRPIGMSGSLITSDLCQLLAARLADCPALATYLMSLQVHFEVSAATIRSVMRKVGEQLHESSSGDLQYAAGRLLEQFTNDVDTVPDLLLLFDECGEVIDGESRKRLACKISRLIGEDVSEGEYSEEEGRIYHRLLNTCIIRMCKSDECVSVDLSPLSITYLIRYLENLSSSMLEWTVISNLFERASSNVVLALKLARVILCDPTKFQLHPKLLEAVIQHEKLLQACQDLIPGFADLLDCHYNSVMLSQFTRKRLPYISVSSPLRNDQLVEGIRSGNMSDLKFEYLPAALFLKVENMESSDDVTAGIFWSLLMENPHSALGALWDARTESIARNTHMLLLHNLLSIARSPLRKSLNEKMERGFVLAFTSVVSSLVRAIVKSRPDLIDRVFTRIEASHCFSSVELTFMRRVHEDSDQTNSTSEREFIDAAVEELLRTAHLKDVRVFHCLSFWKTLRSALEAEHSLHRLSNNSIHNGIVSRLLFAWDILPHVRPLIAPILSLLDWSVSSVPHAELEFQNAVTIVKDYCHLILSNPRLDTVGTFSSCLSILSCETFDESAILCPAIDRRIPAGIDESGPPRWLSCFFLDIVGVINCDAEDSAILDVINGCASNVYKLCQILAPYVLAIDNSDGEAIVSILLQYARLLVDSEVNDSMESARCRMARCLAECVDGIGLYRLSRVNLEDHEEYFDGMCSLIKCCLMANLPTYAYAVANVLHDRMLAKENCRCLAALDGNRLENEQLLQLLKNVYLALGSTAALRSLPIKIQNDDNVRLMLSKARFQWLDVISNSAASYQEMMDAHWYCGVDRSERCRELKYGLALRREEWTEVSYPKKFGSHEETLFSAMYVGGHCASSLKEFLRHIENLECGGSVSDWFPSPSIINNLRDLKVLRPSYEACEEDLMEMSLNRLLLYATSFLRRSKNNTSKDGKAHNFVISVLVKRLCERKAYAACLSILERYPSNSSTLERCRVFMAKNDFNTADSLLHTLLDSNEIEIRVESRCILAELLAYHKNMLDEAITLLRQGIESIEEDPISCEVRLRLFSLLHQLAARQLSGIEEHMESRAFRMREDAIREWTRQRSVAARGPPSHTVRRIECELRCEKEAVDSVKRKLVAAAVDTVAAGLEALKLLSQPYIKQPCQPMERNDDILRLIFPLIDVIFRFDRDKDVVKAFRGYIAHGMVPAVWIHVVSHLMSHCFTKSILAPVIRTMIVKLIIAYPYHVLHTVLMYKFNENHAYIVETLLEEAERRISDKTARSRLHEIIEDMTTAHVAYIQFVSVKISDTRFFEKRQLPGSKAVQYEMKDGLSIISQGDVLRRVPLPVVDQKLGIAGDYSGQDIVMWGTMERVCIQADGLSAPKVLRTKGSDGKLYKIIWKNEDVRQDSLVEQLFSVVNGILNRGEPSAFLRTYKVVPLDSKCGIIEFCQGTVSLKELLCGTDLISGLHVREEPGDSKALQVRTMLKDAAKTQVNEASKMFREACAHFKPVFRHFFYGQHCTVQSWAHMIDNYRRSLAQWSIVTYVVGLGDRHLSNVLFETDTCKLVHIDLGMILEYSKRTLPIPERVPFRLTRDLLDPILIEGTDGRLRENAVRAMRLLRESKHVILGLASVLLRETISNFEEVEPNAGERPSFVSETAIARLRDKLNGTDDTFGVQDVEHQVRRLFAEATSVDNLSRMFVGWMPFV
ncbi:hypothetical protein GCK32_001836 [Trichostrongylus colubriformis]|uniref:non-specific serine/threonine protein kinase n=1 Tax=Trichostrongylus colubriformis TaxID=6319 RepID=A0AAN8FPR5_TRICO